MSHHWRPDRLYTPPLHRHLHGRPRRRRAPSAGSLFAQQPRAGHAGVPGELRRNAGFWTARGGTIGWLINPAGAIAVDSQFPDTAALCVERLLKESGKTEIAALINTHHHGDHTGGNGVFRSKTKQIIGHANVPKYMQAAYDQAMARRKPSRIPPPTTPAPAEPAVPDRTFTDTWSFEHGDERSRRSTTAPRTRAAMPPSTSSARTSCTWAT
jgi:glyoxylase-like metal-dependent hydrolase (beta-lactamase superfamily II)